MNKRIVDNLLVPHAEPEPEGGMVRSKGRGIGVDGDITVEAVAWEDGTFTVDSVTRREAEGGMDLRTAAQELVDFYDGGGFRANFPEELFRALRAALVATEARDEAAILAILDDAEEHDEDTIITARRLIDWMSSLSAVPGTEPDKTVPE